MKKYILPILMTLLIIQSCNSKAAKNCGKSCKETSCATDKTTNMKTDTSKTIACKLTTPELQERKATVIAELNIKQLEKVELKDGYSFKYDDSDSTIDMLTEFIKSERQCCDFFDFAIRIKDGFAWLDITGPKGAKEFITAEMELK